MVNRYSLRFDAGERQGESIAVPPTGLTVGRRPDQTLQILDSSVSGRHAELVVDAQGVLVRDLGSTNGTRVRGERVLELRLVHGDRVVFGNVSVTFVDSEAANRPEAAAQKAASTSEPEIERVSQNALARSRKRPKIALYALVFIAVIGVGAGWYLRRSGPVSARATKAVQAPPGNLLDDYSFESESDVWTSAGDSPTAFQRASDARYSGTAGLACALDAHTSAVSMSKVVRGEPHKEFKARAMMRCAGGARGAIGLEFSHPVDGAEGALGSMVLWSQPLVPGSDFTRAEITATLPPGYAAVRVLVRAASDGEPGRVDVDDVALFEGPGSELPSIAFGERRLVSSGLPCLAATLLDGERVQVSGIQFRVAEALFPDEGLPFAVREDPPKSGRIVIAALDAPSGGTATSIAMHLRCEASLRQAAAGTERSFDGGIATVGDDGYKTHGLDFERKRATDLLLGSGRNLVRITVADGATIHGQADEGSSRISISFDGAKHEAVLQLDFQRERVEAGNVAHAARGAEKRGELGESLRQWSVLLNTYPYEESLVREAEAARARLTEKGLEELRLVRADADNARFFRLTALFHHVREKAQRIGVAYASSEVEAQARMLISEIDADLVHLESAERTAERTRLASIALALKANSAAELARAVEEYMRTHLQGGE